MRVSSASRVKTRPGLAASASRISNSTKVRSTRSPRTVTVRLAGSMCSPPTETGDSVSGSSVARDIPALRSAAFTRLRNSCIENGFVM